MTRKCLISLACGVILSAAQPLRAADIKFVPFVRSGDFLGFYTLSGRIEKGDAERLRRLVPPKDAEGGLDIQLRVNSPGGDLFEAMVLGRFLRERRALILVDKRAPATCASACVMLFAGAVHRFAFSRIGEQSDLIIHRPYLENDGGGSLAAIWRRMTSELRNYLAEMNVPESLADLMLSIPPEAGRALTRKEVEYFRLNGPDPVEDERLNALHAAEFGLSAGEYRRRVAAAITVCYPAIWDDPLPLMERVRVGWECTAATVLGLPVAVYRERQALADAKCRKDVTCIADVLNGRTKAP